MVYTDFFYTKIKFLNRIKKINNLLKLSINHQGVITYLFKSNSDIINHFENSIIVDILKVYCENDDVCDCYLEYADKKDIYKKTIAIANEKLVQIYTSSSDEKYIKLIFKLAKKLDEDDKQKFVDYIFSENIYSKLIVPSVELTGKISAFNVVEFLGVFGNLTPNCPVEYIIEECVKQKINVSEKTLWFFQNNGKK